MKLNPECIRDILFDIESETSFGKPFEYEPTRGKITERLLKYEPEEVFYHIKQCELNGYLYNVSWYMDPSCMVIDLMPKAHSFLSDIREDSNWAKTKEISKKVGSTSLNALAEIATGVISSLIQKQLGLQ